MCYMKLTRGWEKYIHEQGVRVCVVGEGREAKWRKSGSYVSRLSYSGMFSSLISFHDTPSLPITPQNPDIPPPCFSKKKT